MAGLCRTRRMSGGKRKGTRKNDMMMGGKRENDMMGGKRENDMMGGKRENDMMGGKRKGTRKNNVMMGGKRKASPWNKFVKKIFGEMRRKDKDATFSDALKEASRRKSEM